MSQAVTIYEPKQPMPLERQIARRIGEDIPYYLTREEADRMIAAATKPRDRMLLATLWATGGRISEVVQLRRCDFDYKHLKLINLKQKRASEKLVYVAADYALALVAYCDQQQIPPTGYLFPAKRSGRPISARMARRIVSAAAEQAGVFKVKDGQAKPAHPHLFRHGHCIHLLRNGVPVRIVRQQMGHASLLTTERYMQFSEADRAHFIGEAMR